MAAAGGRGRKVDDAGRDMEEPAFDYLKSSAPWL